MLNLSYRNFGYVKSNRRG